MLGTSAPRFSPPSVKPGAHPVQTLDVTRAGIAPRRTTLLASNIHLRGLQTLNVRYIHLNPPIAGWACRSSGSGPPIATSWAPWPSPGFPRRASDGPRLASLGASTPTSRPIPPSVSRNASAPRCSRRHGRRRGQGRRCRPSDRPRSSPILVPCVAPPNAVPTRGSSPHNFASGMRD